MKYIKKLSVIFLVLSMVFLSVAPAYAASGTCEVFYFTYAGSVGAGGSEAIHSYLTELGYSSYRYADVHAYYVRRTMNQDKVFAIVSHGVPGRVVCKDGVTTMSAYAVDEDDNNYSLAAWFGSGNLNGMLFAYYGGCQTALTDEKYGNLLSYTTDFLGASSAIGFSKSVYNSYATYYEEKLFQHLKRGYDVNTSNTLARAATYSKYGGYGNVDSAVIAGNVNTYII